MAKTLFMRAVSSLGTSHRARQLACGAERSYASVDASGQPRRDLLQQPTVAVGIVEQSLRAIGGTFRIEARKRTTRAKVEDLAYLDPDRNQSVSRRFNVR